MGVQAQFVSLITKWPVALWEYAGMEAIFLYYGDCAF